MCSFVLNALTASILTLKISYAILLFYTILRCEFGEFGIESTYNPQIDIFLYFDYLSA